MEIRLTANLPFGVPILFTKNFNLKKRIFTTPNWIAIEIYFVFYILFTNYLLFSILNKFYIFYKSNKNKS